MQKKRKKLTDQYGETKMRTVWLCQTKLGTHSSMNAYFLEKPEEGVLNQVVPATAGMYEKAKSVHVDEITVSGIIFCSRF